jgi:hypothetical protein
MQGVNNLVGPIVFAAVFLPSAKAQETLLRYDLVLDKYFYNYKRETTADIA